MDVGKCAGTVGRNFRRLRIAGDQGGSQRAYADFSEFASEHGRMAPKGRVRGSSGRLWRGGRRSVHSIHDVEYEELRRYGTLLRRNDVVPAQFRHQDSDLSPI